MVYRSIVHKEGFICPAGLPSRCTITSNMAAAGRVKIQLFSYFCRLKSRSSRLLLPSLPSFAIFAVPSAELTLARPPTGLDKFRPIERDSGSCGRQPGAFRLGLIAHRRANPHGKRLTDRPSRPRGWRLTDLLSWPGAAVRPFDLPVFLEAPPTVHTAGHAASNTFRCDLLKIIAEK